MRDARLEQWEARLQRVLERVDEMLEQRHGQRFRRHPARPARGTTANPQYDGLFALAAGFTAGFGSRRGAGYSLDLRIATLDHVPDHARAAIEREGQSLLKKELDTAFPGHGLDVVRDAYGLKIVGNLRLN